MLNFIKKHKIILILLIFTLFLLINTKVNSATKPITVNNMSFPSSVSINNENVVLYNTDYSWVIGKSYIGNTNSNPMRTFLVINTKYLKSAGIYFHCVSFGGSDDKFSINGKYADSFYLFELKNNSWSYVCYSDWIQINRASAAYYISNVNVLHTNGSVTLNASDFSDYNSDFPEFSIEYNETTCSYFCYTQWHVLSDFNRYYYYYSEKYQDSFNIHTCDTDGWTSMFYELEDEDEELTDTSKWRYSQELIGYGEYYFCKWDLDLGEYNIYKIILSEDGESYISYYNQNTGEWETTEIIENVTFDNFNMYVVYDNYSAIIYSNYFSYADRYNYVVTYSLDGINYSHDILTEQYGVDIENDIPGYYRYFKEVIENRTYYFRLQIFDPENNAAIVDTQYFEVVVNGDFYLSDTTKDVAYYRNSSVYRILKDKLGILFYPIDITFEFFERLSKVEESEPIITVPDIQEPFTQKTLINGFTFNLNEVLEDDNILYIYNIYLMFVDCIIYIILFCLLRKVFEQFFNVGGLFGG